MKTPKLFMLTVLIGLLVGFHSECPAQVASDAQNWTHFVRIGGHGLSLSRVDAIMKSVQETGVFGIETDNDIPGRYESFQEPTEKLAAIKAIATAAHKVGNYAFVYIAGTECITANADKTPHSIFKDHPDWVQRKITGESAVFGGGTAFWISAGDEDVWISPYATEWRKIYMGLVRQIAATGIDGIYVDIPYWMTHFDGWEDTWASFDDYTVAAFKEKTGLDAKKDLKLGDFSDANFLKWVDFRIQTLTDFMKEINDNVKSVNPQCMTIPEIYPGIGEEAVRVGSDVYEMYVDMDAIAHEYSAGGYTAARRDPIDWFTYMEGMFTFRAFAGDKATWMLSYSWDKNQTIDRRDAMKNLALSQVMAGANFWDAQGHVMSGSNDYPTRTEIFKWIAANEKTLYSPRQSMQPIGIYFSPATRNYFANDYIESYHGMMHLLLQSHLEFQILTPRNLSQFAGEVLILPDVKILTPEEVAFVDKFVRSGYKLMVTGQTGAYSRERQVLAENPLLALLGITDAQTPMLGKGNMQFVYLPQCPGKAYAVRSVKASFNAGERGDQAPYQILLNEFNHNMIDVLKYQPAVTVQASPWVVAHIANVAGKPHVFLANYGGLKANKNAVPIPEPGAVIVFPATEKSRIHFLPYLGTEQILTGKFASGKMTCTLPAIERGAVVWIE